MEPLPLFPFFIFLKGQLMEVVYFGFILGNESSTSAQSFHGKVT